jgi:hypothetical protein
VPFSRRGAAERLASVRVRRRTWFHLFSRSLFPFLSIPTSSFVLFSQEGPEEGPEARGADPVPRGVRWRFPFRLRSARVLIYRAPRAAHEERERARRPLSLSFSRRVGFGFPVPAAGGGGEVPASPGVKRPRRGCHPSLPAPGSVDPRPRREKERERELPLCRAWQSFARFVPSLSVAVDLSSLLHCFLSSFFRSCLRSAPIRLRDPPPGLLPVFLLLLSLPRACSLARVQPPEHGRGGQDQGADRRHLGQGKRGAGAVRGSHWAFRRATARRGECNEEENGSGGIEGLVVGRK